MKPICLVFIAITSLSACDNDLVKIKNNENEILKRKTFGIHNTYDAENLVIDNPNTLVVHSGDISQFISLEDMDLLSSYVVRAEVKKQMGHNSIYGVTVREAIENQREFEINSAKNRERLKTFNQLYTTQIVSTQLNDDTLSIKISFSNNSDKEIRAIEGEIDIQVEGIDNPTKANIPLHRFKNSIKPNQSQEITITTPLSDMALLKLSQGETKTRTYFEKLMVLNSDNSIEKIGRIQ